MPAIKIDVWLTVAITQAHPDLIAVKVEESLSNAQLGKQ